MMIEVLRDEDGHPFDGVRDGVEYVYGVARDQKLVDHLVYLKACFKSLDHLSRPRNAMDTTDEWLAIFCDLERTMKTIRGMLGDQTDLYPEWNNKDDQAICVHCDESHDIDADHECKDGE